MKESIPIYLFNGFLGSGKTTLLMNALDYYSDCGKRTAVIMNEVGEINVERQNLKKDVPVAEILDGCICCSVKDDLATTILNLCREFQPDVIIIESTGIAYPMETISGITEASFQIKVDLKLIVTVIDAPHFLELKGKNEGTTLKLMEEQIRYGNLLILNKTDKVTTKDMEELKKSIRQYNIHAPIQTTVYCKIDFGFLDTLVGYHMNNNETRNLEPDTYLDVKEHYKHRNNKDLHDHVMVYTHYFDQSIDKEQFEDLIKSLSNKVYRAKGIMHFKNKNGPMLFQYAYKELEMVRFTPKTELTNVAIFIGENFQKGEIIKLIKNTLH